MITPPPRSKQSGLKTSYSPASAKKIKNKKITEQLLHFLATNQSLQDFRSVFFFLLLLLWSKMCFDFSEGFFSKNCDANCRGLCEFLLQKRENRKLFWILFWSHAATSAGRTQMICSLRCLATLQPNGLFCDLLSAVDRDLSGVRKGATVPFLRNGAPPWDWNFLNTRRHYATNFLHYKTRHASPQKTL